MQLRHVKLESFGEEPEGLLKFKLWLNFCLCDEVRQGLFYWVKCSSPVEESQAAMGQESSSSQQGQVNTVSINIRRTGSMKRLGETHNAGDLQQEVVSETSDSKKDSLSLRNWYGVHYMSTMSCSRMLWEEGNIWEYKERIWTQERIEKTEEEQSTLEELFPIARRHHQISMENNLGVCGHWDIHKERTQVYFLAALKASHNHCTSDSSGSRHPMDPVDLFCAGLDDILLTAATGNLPPICRPPGYTSQVEEEIVPQTFDYHMPLTAPAKQVSPFIAPPLLTFPQASQLMYPPVHGEFPIPYFQEAAPQQMPPPPALPPLPLRPPPATFIYQEHHENNTDYRPQPCCSNLEKPVVSNIQTRSATVSWTLTCTEKCDHINSPVTFELALSTNGRNEIYKSIYNGNESTVDLHDLQPCTVYFLRVAAIRGTEHRNVSEVVSFTTRGCEPDPPHAPKLISRTKASLNLQWKASKNNGSKISSFLLQWDEGKGEEFKSCYSGPMKQHEIFNLTAYMKYVFRLAAKNHFGFSNFSEIAVFYTSGNTPPAPLPPKLKEAGVYSLWLEWCAPTNPNPNDTLTYVLEMEEPRSRLGFKPKYNGEDLSCIVKHLQRNTTYKFRIFACNREGRSNPSEEIKYSTCPAKPGYPKKPYVVGAIHAHQVKIAWDSFSDNGGIYISRYSLEVSKNSDSANLWKIIYNGTRQEFLYDGLLPGTTYKLRVFCTSPVGQSQPSDVLTIQTPTTPPVFCRSLLLNSKTKCKDTNLLLDNHSINGNLETVVRGKRAKGPRNDRKEYPGSVKKCTLGSPSMKCETVPARHPPSRWGTPVLTCKGPTCVVVSWEIPKCNGAEITAYRLQWGQDEDSMHLIYTGPCLRYEVKGLIPATTYFCRVQAVNIVGVGMFGGTEKVNPPGTVPAIVPMLQDVEDKVPTKLASSCIAIQWKEPDCHGSPITGYNIKYGDRKILTVDRVTEYVLKNLQPNTTYRIRIQAINHYGLSPFSPSIRSKTKPILQKPPQLDCVAQGHQSLRLKWVNVTQKQSHANFIIYNLLMEDRSGRFSVIYHGPDLTHKVQKLSEYTQYRFKIQACNKVGEGPQSDVYTFTTTKTPPGALKGSPGPLG
ncbi:LOW QUALITY PROTEIN: fibronectin type III domain containing protein 3C1-like [Arvicola amphibius]|uniref:LOW QUALITY PROTEIN: fibronectin type III domain containing protein 3C1-like n=1 Tax=Arvicola amphibius TaxID=1047088 RepID=UPI001C07FCE2|nr:LOW QUALITY PROTEIN: fibronectin type III domain containing protein 3C1-like [Arvicola amphibius]